MIFLKLDGWEIPARAGAGSRVRILPNMAGKGSRGRPRRNESGRVSRWELEAICLNRADADTLEGLLEGKGYHFPFDDDAWSKFTGIGPQPGDVYVVNLIGARRHGYGYLEAVDVTWDLDLPESGYGLAYWRGGPGSWELLQVRSDGAKWLDGVRADATPIPELTVADGGIRIIGEDIDDMKVWPFVPSDNFMDSVFASASVLPFSSAPRLRAEGDLVLPYAACDVLGSVTNQSHVEYTNDDTAGYLGHDREVSFTIEEVSPRRRKRIYRPDLAYLLDEKYKQGSNFHAAAGVAEATHTGGFFVTGPFGKNRACQTIIYPSSTRTTITQEAASRLDGRRRASFAVWAKRGTSALQTLLALSVTPGGPTRVILDVTASEELRLRVRSLGAGGLGTVISAASLWSDGSLFHLVGGDVDLEANEMRLWFDGVLVATTTVVFGNDVFGDTAGAANYIGIGVTLANQWAGPIAAAYIFPDELLPAHEWRAMFERGKEGVLI